MKKSTLTFLGKDAGFGEKNTSAFFIDGKDFYLFDCGYTVFNLLKEKIDFTQLENIYIFITHLHNDHAGSLSQLLLFLWYVHHKKATVISKCCHIKDYLSITGTDNNIYEVTQQFNDVEFIPTKHSEYLDSYGIKVTLNNKKIVYSGDTAELETFYPYLTDADEFYVDTSIGGYVHLKISDVFEELLKIQKSSTDVFLMHLDNQSAIREIVQDSLYFAE